MPLNSSVYLNYIKKEVNNWLMIIKRLLILAGIVFIYMFIDTNFYDGKWTWHFPVREVIDTLYTEYGCTFRKDKGK